MKALTPERKLNLGTEAARLLSVQTKERAEWATARAQYEATIEKLTKELKETKEDLVKRTEDVAQAKDKIAALSKK